MVMRVLVMLMTGAAVYGGKWGGGNSVLTSEVTPPPVNCTAGNQCGEAERETIKNASPKVTYLPIVSQEHVERDAKSLEVKDGVWFPISRSKVYKGLRLSKLSSPCPNSAGGTKSHVSSVRTNEQSNVKGADARTQNNIPKAIGNISLEKLVVVRVKERSGGAIEKEHSSKPNFIQSVSGIQSSSNTSQPLWWRNEEKEPASVNRSTSGNLSPPPSSATTTTISSDSETTLPSALQTTDADFPKENQEEKENANKREREPKTTSKNELLLEDNSKLARKYDRNAIAYKDKKDFRFSELNAEEQIKRVDPKYPRYLLVQLRNKRSTNSVGRGNHPKHGEEDEKVATKVIKDVKQSAKASSTESEDLLEEVLRRGIKSYLESKPLISKHYFKENEENGSYPHDRIKPPPPPPLVSSINQFQDQGSDERSGSQSLTIIDNVEDEFSRSNNRETTFFNPSESVNQPVFNNVPEEYELLPPRKRKNPRVVKGAKRLPQREDIRKGTYISVVEPPNLDKLRPGEDYSENRRSSGPNENGVWKQSMRDFARGRSLKTRDTGTFANIQDNTEDLPASRGIKRTSFKTQGLYSETSPQASVIKYGKGAQQRPWKPSSGASANNRQDLGNLLANFGNVGGNLVPSGFLSAGDILGAGGTGGNSGQDLSQLLSGNLGSSPYAILNGLNGGSRQQRRVQATDLSGSEGNPGSGGISNTNALSQTDLASLLQSVSPNTNSVDLAALLNGNSPTDISGGSGSKGINQPTGGASIPSLDLAAILSGNAGAGANNAGPWNPWQGYPSTKKSGSSNQGNIDPRTLSLIQNLISGGGKTVSPPSKGSDSGGSSSNISGGLDLSQLQGFPNPWSNNPPGPWAMPTASPMMMMMMGGD